MILPARKTICASARTAGASRWHWSTRVSQPKQFRGDSWKKISSHFPVRNWSRCSLTPEQGVSLLRDALTPMRSTLQRQPYLAGAEPNFADYIVFGSFQWARAVSLAALVEAGDPVFEWRERLLDAFGGFARTARH